MTNKTLLCTSLFLLLALPAAFAQQTGAVEGRVVNATDPSIAVGAVELDIVDLGSGMRILKTAMTGADGSFRVDGLPASGRLMARVNYRDVNYHRQFALENARANVTVEVYEPTRSMQDLRIEGIRMAFQLEGDRLRSLEAVTVDNRTRPPRTFMDPEGNFRISKPAGILEPPEISVTAPGSSMPVVQAALESPDGRSYYSLYPLKPGTTTFEVQQALPYTNRSYVLKKRFYQDIESIEIGVMPQDMELSGEGLKRVSTNPQQNFSVYRSGPVKAGVELVWTFSGGTAAAAPEPGSERPEQESGVQPVPDAVRRNALAIGSLLLLGLVLALWIAFNRAPAAPRATSGGRARERKEQRENLLQSIAELDHRAGNNAIDRQEYLKQREALKRRLRRISLAPKT